MSKTDSKKKQHDVTVRVAQIGCIGVIIAALIGAIGGNFNTIVDVTKLIVENRELSFENYKLRELTPVNDALTVENKRLSDENALLYEVAERYDSLMEQQQELLSELRVCKTVWLSDLKYIARNGDGWVKWPVDKKDSAGNTYEHGGIYAGSGTRTHTEHSITYSVNSKHTNFFGTLVTANISHYTSAPYIIKIYGEKENGEEEMVYSSPLISGGFHNCSFDIDIAEYKIIQIVRIAGGTAEIGLVNAGFY